MNVEVEFAGVAVQPEIKAFCADVPLTSGGFTFTASPKQWILTAVLPHRNHKEQLPANLTKLPTIQLFWPGLVPDPRSGADGSRCHSLRTVTQQIELFLWIPRGIGRDAGLLAQIRSESIDLRGWETGFVFWLAVVSDTLTTSSNAAFPACGLPARRQTQWSRSLMLLYLRDKMKQIDPDGMVVWWIGMKYIYSTLYLSTTSYLLWHRSTSYFYTVAVDIILFTPWHLFALVTAYFADSGR